MLKDLFREVIAATRRYPSLARCWMGLGSSSSAGYPRLRVRIHVRTARHVDARLQRRSALRSQLDHPRQSAPAIRRGLIAT